MDMDRNIRVNYDTGHRSARHSSLLATGSLPELKLPLLVRSRKTPSINIE